jgi:hypothetical protein
VILSTRTQILIHTLSSFGRPGVSKSRNLGESNVQSCHSKVLESEVKQLGHWRHRAGSVGVEDIPILNNTIQYRVENAKFVDQTAANPLADSHPFDSAKATEASFPKLK